LLKIPREGALEEENFLVMFEQGVCFVLLARARQERSLSTFG
jgi:hypothetical protein